MTTARTKSVDVVIVGAGLAGLSAADQLTQEDHDVIVLEGRDRVGGRVAWTSFGRFLREPVGLVHWAGTETADKFSGTMNGAILSGHRAASEVSARLAASGT